MKVEPHQFAKKAAEVLTKAGIPIAGYDKFRNPFIHEADLPRIPFSLKSTLVKDNCCRICIRSYKQ